MKRVGRLRRVFTRHEHPYAVIAATVLMKSGASRWLRIRRDGYSLRFFNSAISMDLFLNPQTRTREERLYARLLRPGDTVIDVGANIGHLTLAAAHLVGQTGRVHSFEVHPRIVEYLRANVALNRAAQVTVHACAVSDTGDAVAIDASRGDDQTFVKPGGRIPAVRLDDVFPPETKVRLIKIDTEGHERAVLLGARRILAATDYVWCECYKSSCERNGYNQRDLAALLLAAGFDLFRFAGDGFARIDPDALPHKINLLGARVLVP